VKASGAPQRYEDLADPKSGGVELHARV